MPNQQLYALSLTQPWALLVVLGLKQWETRSWSTKFRGRVYIHAAKNFPGWAKDYFNVHIDFRNALNPLGYTSPTQLPLGAIIGRVEIVRVEQTYKVRDGLSRIELVFGDYSPGRFAFLMQNPVHFKTYIPAIGKLGFWKIPDEAARLIQAEEENDGNANSFI